jgi:ABC-type transport system involved in cytochrome c biogenesis permease component
VARKDLAIEFRTRTAFFSALVFAVLGLTIFFFAWDSTAVSSLDLAPGVLWVILTLFSAMAVNTRLAELLLPMLSLPFFVPIVMSAAQATARVLAGRPVAEAWPWLKILTAYDIVFLVACTMAFPFTLEE